jgi:hypothetical protein
LSGKLYQTRFDGVITVPDGMWVAEVESSDYLEVFDRYGENDLGEFESVNSREYEVIGVENFKRHTLDCHSRGGYSYGSKSSWSHSLIVSDRDHPFGIVCWQTEYNMVMPGRYFICARQIHKGELGSKPKINRPKFARQASEPYRFGHQKKVHQHGWARLVDVTRLCCLPADAAGDLILTYFAFTDAEYPRLDVIIAEREEIHGQPLSHGRIRRLEKDEIGFLRTHELDQIWIRQGFAVTLLMLRHFGYAPVSLDAVSSH